MKELTTKHPLGRLIDRIEYTAQAALDHAQEIANVINDYVYVYATRQDNAPQWEIYTVEDIHMSGFHREPDICIEPENPVKYELFYSSGGHKGAYPDLQTAISAAKLALGIDGNETYIDLAPRSRTQYEPIFYRVTHGPQPEPGGFSRPRWIITRHYNHKYRNPAP